MRCCVEDEGFVALRVALRGGVKPGRRARASRCRGVESNQVASEPGWLGLSWDEPGGCPCISQAVPGMEAARAWSAAFTRNVGRRPLADWNHGMFCPATDVAVMYAEPAFYADTCVIGRFL